MNQLSRRRGVRAHAAAARRAPRLRPVRRHQPAALRRALPPRPRHHARPDARRALGRLHGRRLCAGHRPGRRLRGAVAAAAPPTSCRAWSRPTSRSIPVLAVTTDIAVGVARPLRADRARPGGAVPAADQVEPGDRPRRPDPAGACARAFRAHDHRPARARRISACRSTCRRTRSTRREVHADPTLGVYPARRTAPEPAAIAAAAERSLSAERPLFICGGGAGDRRRRGRAAGARRAARARRSRPRSAARAASPRTTRSRSAWSAATAARRATRARGRRGRPRRVRRLPRRLGHDRALALSGAGQGRASSTSTSTRR